MTMTALSPGTLVRPTRDEPCATRRAGFGTQSATARGKQRTRSTVERLPIAPRWSSTRIGLLLLPGSCHCCWNDRLLRDFELSPAQCHQLRASAHCPSYTERVPTPKLNRPLPPRLRLTIRGKGQQVECWKRFQVCDCFTSLM